MPGVRTYQAERRFVTFDELCKVGTALSADWMRPSRSPHSIGRYRSDYKVWSGATSDIFRSCRSSGKYRVPFYEHPAPMALQNPNSHQYPRNVATHRLRLSILSFPQAVTQPVGRDNEKDFVRDISISVDSESSFFLIQPIRLQFRKGRLGIVDFKEAAFLRWIAAIFG